MVDLPCLRINLDLIWSVQLMRKLDTIWRIVGRTPWKMDSPTIKRIQRSPFKMSMHNGCKRTNNNNMATLLEKMILKLMSIFTTHNPKDGSHKAHDWRKRLVSHNETSSKFFLQTIPTMTSKVLVKSPSSLVHIIASLSKSYTCQDLPKFSYISTNFSTITWELSLT